MNEILQKRIEEKSKELGQMFFPDNMNCFARPNWEAGYIETACKEIANFALQNQWVSVEEALPTERDEEDEQYSTNVFARTKDCIRYAYYDFYNESWCSVECGYRFGGDVTHWMSIPSLEGGEK